MNPINALTAVTHHAPYPYYAGLVSGPPLIFDRELGLWIASRAAVVTEVLENPHCRVRPALEQVPRALAGLPVGDIFGHLVRMNDGEKHALPKIALRRALARLDQARVAGCARNAVHALNELYDLRSEQAFAPWSHSLPIYIVASLLGFDEAALPKIDAWMSAFVASLSPLSTGEQIALGADAAHALLERFAALAMEEGTQEGSLLRLVRQEAHIAGWHDASAILANAIGLLSQTYDATAGLIGNSVVALLTQPGLEEIVRDRPSAIAELVREVSRFDPPVQNTRRFVVQPTSIAGIGLAAGDVVLLSLAAANRDPQANARPGELLLERPDRRVFAFGHGPHACPGQALAASIAAAGISTLLQTPTAIRGRAVSWSYRPSLNGRIPIFKSAPAMES
ncbi:cytochrome P450 [Massilia sp. RP-1-19]|uniref:Cytochrome P450 n=1 Tax=Massilia polaris TaxID=2728846 RepID=A0A848HM39_9BURK|nr:cytochrome P450 [Massilia polaris]NML62435.1 cytochrome P450 [Massilia polaris]